MDKTEIKAKYFRGTEEPLFFRDNCLEGLKNLGQVFFCKHHKRFHKNLEKLNLCNVQKSHIFCEMYY